MDASASRDRHGVFDATITLRFPIIDIQEVKQPFDRENTPKATSFAAHVEDGSPFSSDSDSESTTTDEELSTAEICYAKRIEISSPRYAKKFGIRPAPARVHQSSNDSLEDFIDYLTQAYSNSDQSKRSSGASDTHQVDQQTQVPRNSRSLNCGKKNGTASTSKQAINIPGRVSSIVWDDEVEWYSPGLDLDYKDPYTRVQKLLFNDFLQSPFSEAHVKPEESISPFDTRFMTPPQTINR